jgi:3-hydroxybutyrate dehydrogenase
VQVPTSCSTASATRQEIEALRAGLASEYGVEVAVRRRDMSKPDQIHAMIKSAVERLGTVDILVNNAGIQHTAPVESFPHDRWDAVIAINLSSAFPCHPGGTVRDEGTQLGPDRQHRIGTRPGRLREKSAYVAAKHGVLGTDQDGGAGTGQDGHHLQRDMPRLGPDPAGAETDRCSCRARGGISVEQAKSAMLAEKQPSGEFATPEQIGALCVFLLLGGRGADPGRRGAGRWRLAGQ